MAHHVNGSSQNTRQKTPSTGRPKLPLCATWVVTELPSECTTQRPGTAARRPGSAAETGPRLRPTRQSRHRPTAAAGHGCHCVINNRTSDSHRPSRSTISRFVQSCWVCKHVQRHRSTQDSDLAAATRANRPAHAPSSRQASTGLALHIRAMTQQQEPIIRVG